MPFGRGRTEIQVDKAIIRSTIFRLLRRALAISAAVSLLFGATDLFADVQTLSGGGCGEEPGCYPVVLDLTPVLVFKQVNGQNVEVEIHVSFAGMGWHGTSATPFTVTLRIVGQSQEASSMSSLSFLGTDPANFGTCYTMRGMYIHHVTVAVHTSIEFYVEVTQQGGGGICRATSATDAVNVDEDVQPPAGLDPPRPGELGIPNCVKGLGDPIDLTTGNVYVQRSDVGLPTDRGLPIEITRSGFKIASA